MRVLLLACRCPLSYCALTWERELWSHCEGPDLMTSSNLIISQRPHLLIPSRWRLGLQHMNWGARINIQSIIVPLGKWNGGPQKLTQLVHVWSLNKIKYIAHFLIQFSFSEATVPLLRWKRKDREHLTLIGISTLSLTSLFFSCYLHDEFNFCTDLLPATITLLLSADPQKKKLELPPTYALVSC